MNRSNTVIKRLALGFCVGLSIISFAFADPISTGSDKPPGVPRFSIGYMDTAIEPGSDFYHYADGTWLKNNPVPADKSRWGAFAELQERNWFLIHGILDGTLTRAAEPNSPVQKVADFYRSAIDTNRLESLGFKPIEPDLKRIAELKSNDELPRLLADFQARGIGAGFGRSASPDAKNSSVYAFYVSQGGLGLPDRDYYLSDRFAKQREAYVGHMTKMFGLIGEEAAAAKADAATVLEIETALAKASKSRVDLRNPIANYHKMPVADLVRDYPDLSFKLYLSESGLGNVPEVIVRQPEFFRAFDELSRIRSLGDWKTYLRWHLLRTTAPYLHAAAENEAFAFYGKVLRDQESQEPRWQRAAHMIDSEIGEALGQLFVEKYFPMAARVRMNELVDNLKAVFKDRLQKVDWMTDATRAKALAKFEKFTQKIGHPEKFRDYSSVEVRRDDLLGNIQRAEVFETRRTLHRVGEPVDRSEWRMTPETVNAYFNPLQNEIVFPAGILQPPFFDMEMDDAVNYGGIGVVIGHEITHGYDDQGRKYDADGNLNDWWTESDGKAFEARAQKVVDQFDAYEPLPGLHVNGKLTLGENIADLGGASIAYEALQRSLAKDPSKRKQIDGLTPEQRFFLSFSQVWRTNCKEAELRRLITVDPHSPGQYRAIGAPVNLQEFYQAFGIQTGAAMWRAPELRAKIW
jgi:putative endopeptidase